MAGLFNLPPRSTREGDKNLSAKARHTSKQNSGVSIKGGQGLLQRIQTIIALCESQLGKYADRYLCIRNLDELHDYITAAIEAGILAIDTETTGLDPMTVDIAGFSICTRNRKAAYIPLNHVSYVTGVRVEEQIDPEDAAKELARLNEAGTKLIKFNAPFDIRVIMNTLGVRLKCYWDCYVAARLLNENEGDGNNGLKALHKKYCLKGEGDAFTFGSLFKGIPFTMIPIKSGYIYAARDAEITLELYNFQEPYLNPEAAECKRLQLQDVAWVMHNIEMPIVDVVVNMEERGVSLDKNYASELSAEYHKLLEQREAAFYETLNMYNEEIEMYMRTHSDHKLSNPISISSPQQLSTLFYDILKVGVISKKEPRGTGEAILLKMDHPLGQRILDYREVAKLLSTYIDKLPATVNEKTQRVHAKFNQMGAATGRFSSNDPNLQNIPSHDTKIRKMFVATKDYVLMSSDYSAQEPRLTAHMSGDERMIQAYRDGKDVYVEIASLAFDLPYDECKEFRADGTKNPQGKDRRNSAKAIVLGICYGKGIPAIAEDLRITVQRAQEIYDKVMKGFPCLKSFMEDSENMAREKGYVTTVWGRKRRLPDMQLPAYEFTREQGVTASFDPLDFESGEMSYEVDDATCERYTRQLLAARSWKQKDNIKQRALAEGIKIKDNGGFIAEATRQCVNSRIQGSAADQTKLAMILVDNDAQLQEYGFRMLLPVHDELIGECPKATAAKAAKRLGELMVLAAKDLVVPSKCDVEVTERWYGEEYKLEEECA